MSFKGLRFNTGFTYHDRRGKAEYVWRKYGSILSGSVLDVGADQGYLRSFLGEGASYTGIGLSAGPGISMVDLEKGPIPFGDDSFDCVLCLDVLEHLDNVHFVFDSLCRVTRQWLIISLPNPWAVFWGGVTVRQYAPGRQLKFYGLPTEPDPDRHKWFFSSSEAREFVRYRSEKNGMEIVQYDNELWPVDPPAVSGSSIRSFFTRLAMSVVLRKGLEISDLYNGPSWWVLRKRSGGVV